MAAGRHLGALLYVAAAVCVFAVHPLEDPTCTLPERAMEDKDGAIKLRELQTKGLTYDASMFEIEGDAAPLRAGTEATERIMFKAPIHTCRIKLMPGVREWVTTEPQQYGVPIEVAPYSQPPNFNFVSADNRLLLKVTVRDDATVADINNFLAAHGVHKMGEEPVPAAPVSAPSSASRSSGSSDDPDSVGLDL